MSNISQLKAEERVKMQATKGRGGGGFIIAIIFGVIMFIVMGNAIDARPTPDNGQWARNGQRVTPTLKATTRAFTLLSDKQDTPATQTAPAPTQRATVANTPLPPTPYIVEVPVTVEVEKFVTVIAMVSTTPEATHTKQATFTPQATLIPYPTPQPTKNYAPIIRGYQDSNETLLWVAGIGVAASLFMSIMAIAGWARKPAPLTASGTHHALDITVGRTELTPPTHAPMRETVILYQEPVPEPVTPVLEPIPEVIEVTGTSVEVIPHIDDDLRFRIIQCWNDYARIYNATGEHSKKPSQNKIYKDVVKGNRSAAMAIIRTVLNDANLLEDLGDG